MCLPSFLLRSVILTCVQLIYLLQHTDAWRNIVLMLMCVTQLVETLVGADTTHQACYITVHEWKENSQ